MKYQKEGKCASCGYIGVIDLHHIKSRKSGGSDDHENILDLCRRCHMEAHAIGRNSFINKYPHLESILKQKGWIFEEFCQKWLRLTNEGIEND